LSLTSGGHTADYHFVTVSDDQWVAAARARAASGEWERPAEVILAELRQQAAAKTASQPPLPPCPACAEHPAMLKLPRYELLTQDPLLYCGACYGFWAVGDSLARGVADPGYIHPALETTTAPRRCRTCFGHLKPDDTCAKCGGRSPELNCPACGAPMERFDQGGVRLDQCAPCRGTWFDTGEIVAAYKLVPVQSLAMSTVDELASENEPPAWWIAASILGRLFIAFPG